MWRGSRKASPDEEWFAQIPATVAACAKRWDLVVGERLSGGLVAHVVGCRTGAGEEAVLKVIPPLADEFAGTPQEEAVALRAWNGRGAVQLLAFAPDLRALLMRRAIPGTPLREGEERCARREVAEVLSRLFAAAVLPVDLPRLGPAADRYLLRKPAISQDAKQLLEPAVDLARDAARRLVASGANEVLLHGDVMNKNLLRGQHGLVAIDPMPRAGDAHSDIGFWAATRSPVHELEGRAAEIATMLGLDADRASRWAAVYAVGAACEAWRRDTRELREWVFTARAQELLGAR